MTRWAWLGVGLAGCAVSAAADWVVLHNGERLRGQVENRAADPVVLVMPSMTARIERADIAEVVVEAPEVYFVEAARACVEQGVLRDAARLVERGRGTCAEALAPVALAIEALEAARSAEAELDFATAVDRARAAREAFGPSAQLDRELARLEKVKVFFDANKSLPGELLERANGPIAILHHHPKDAVRWWDEAAAELVRVVPTMRRSVHHKLPEEAVFVLVVHRDRDEYLAATKGLSAHGLLPDTDQARLVSRTRGATYAEVASKHLPALVARFAALALYEFAPLWLTEGLASGAAAPTAEAACRETATALAAAAPLSSLESVMKTSHYGDLDFVARERFFGLSRSFVRYVAGSRDGVPKVSRAIEHARNAMLADLLNPGKKHFKLKSYRIEDLLRGYLPLFVPKELGFDDVGALEKDYTQWIATGKRKGK